MVREEENSGHMDLGCEQENQPAAGAWAGTVSAEGASFHPVALWEVKFWEALPGTPQSAEGEPSTCKTWNRGVGGKGARVLEAVGGAFN